MTRRNTSMIKDGSCFWSRRGSFRSIGESKYPSEYQNLSSVLAPRALAWRVVSLTPFSDISANQTLGCEARTSEGNRISLDWSQETKSPAVY